MDHKNVGLPGPAALETWQVSECPSCSKGGVILPPKGQVIARLFQWLAVFLTATHVFTPL
ncbi:hypothetical protein COCSUDRAFT_34421 [Coccomyxa subellipsoidea C-169]|uniref:Uncharacterized protein n=1 Tax=Coccomyxa subellipsoidea (strain C-169) TaxID=574566 RepID=I0YKI3_COCSC|nr:hypothetical protein COCSUDRAFT_34421 [Coccomyxa subellipsoidea C-169]EIE18902.1 hypothetical protein COCSUDRAFT_34421 [Coccomyxa subellipsoidea C-169]|eukprot:XP_005643446.1 hypothetical protein COCSUDRAFT_34421 [Coccomyxa subellipsoidea C-169]